MKVKISVFNLAFILILVGEFADLVVIFQNTIFSNGLVLCGCVMLIWTIIMKKFRFKYLLLMSIGAFITFFSALFSNTNSLFVLFIFLMACPHTDKEQILRTYRICATLIVLLVAGCTLMGLLPNVVYYRQSMVRYAMGFIYPTCLADIFFIVMLISLYLRKDKLLWREVIIWEIFNYLIYKISGSRVAFLLGIVMPFVFVFLKYIGYAKNKKNIILKIAIFIYPICSIMSYLMCKFYNYDGILALLDRLTSRRIYYGHKMLEEYGVHLFGQKINWVGYGGNADNLQSLWNTYNYVDNGYIKILLEQGLIFFIFILICYTYMTYRIYLEKNIYLCMVMIFIALYCLIEPNLIRFYYNPFVIFIGDYLKLIFSRSLYLRLRDAKQTSFKEIHVNNELGETR